MAENNCYLCQEPKSVVGHSTQSCPSVKCKKCGQKGHILRNCSNFNSKVDGCSKEIKSEKSVVLNNEANILDFDEEIGLNEAMLESLHTKLMALDKEITFER